jgi:uncharacterized membrane protein YccF (DUF307 family)
MFMALYGNLRINSKKGIYLFPLKVLYIILTLPFLVFSLLLAIKSLGAFGNPLKEKIGFKKKIILHVTANVVSVFIWMALLGCLIDYLKLNK